MDWIDPYLNKRTGEFLGLNRYEETDEPTFLFKLLRGRPKNVDKARAKRIETHVVLGVVGRHLADHCHNCVVGGCIGNHLAVILNVCGGKSSSPGSLLKEIEDHPCLQVQVIITVGLDRQARLIVAQVVIDRLPKPISRCVRDEPEQAVAALMRWVA